MKQSEHTEKMVDELDPRIACLIHLHIFEALTPVQQEELDNWVNENETNRRTFMVATNGVEIMEGVDFLDHEIPQDSKPLEKIKQKLHFEQPVLAVQPDQLQPRVKKVVMFHYKQWIAAASIIFVVGVGTALYSSSSGSDVPPDILPGKSTATLNFDGSNVQLDQTNNKVVDMNGYSIMTENGHVKYTASTEYDEETTKIQHVISTPRAGTYSMILSDGTKVWLNPASTISFPPVFPGHERKVTITGEAFFEVATVMVNGAKKPFIVEVKDKDVRVEVLGTHFNINAYAEEPVVRTTLIEGSIKVMTSAQTSLLKPGQQADVKSRNIEVTDVGMMGAEAAKAWKEGNFDFQKSDIESLLREIARWYDMQVEFRTEKQIRHFGGQVTRNKKLTEVLKTLELNGIITEIKGNKIIVTAMAKRP